MILSILLFQNQSFFSVLFQRIHEGGLFFMCPIVLMLLLTLFLIVISVLAIRKENPKIHKYISLINSIGLLALVYGILGQLIGLVEAFDKIQGDGEVSQSILAFGLKISALPTILGSFVFVISKVGTIILTWINTTDHHE